MDRRFDELSKSLAASVSRREALRKFGFGLSGVVLAALGLSSNDGAAAQVSAQCCLWHCYYTPPGGKRESIQVKTCGTPCSMPDGLDYCQLKSSKTVPDC